MVSGCSVACVLLSDEHELRVPSQLRAGALSQQAGHRPLPPRPFHRPRAGRRALELLWVRHVTQLCPAWPSKATAQQAYSCSASFESPPAAAAAPLWPMRRLDRTRARIAYNAARGGTAHCGAATAAQLCIRIQVPVGIPTS
eukprot:COSAG01_NODE_1176_length_11374_cov_476.847805_2_plen_142_part_00